MARNFELPWDTKPVNRERLSDVIAYLEANGWAEYRSVLALGYTILAEIEGYSRCKVFVIPSVRKPTIWNKIFKTW